MTRILGLLAVGLLVLGGRAQGQTVDAGALAVELAAVGERVGGGEGHRRARRLLVERMAAIGLADVGEHVLPNGAVNLTATSPGAGLGEVILAAHYDTVAASPGALDDASGCAVALAVMSAIHAVPHNRTIRLLLSDGEERGLLGSVGFVGSLDEVARDAVLAAVVVDMVGSRGAGAPLILDVPVREAGRRIFTPGWLVHAVLRSGKSVGFPFRVGSRHGAVAAQVLTRTTRSSYTSDHAPFLAAGIPAILVTDFDPLRPHPAHHTAGDVAGLLDPQRLSRWTDAIAATVLRLDRQAGRPLWEDEYLAAFGRVWIRRDVMWVGFLLWMAMVLLARPGRWAGADRSERRSRGRRFLPGYLFRLGFLVVTLLSPTVAGPLVFPLALLSVWRWRFGGSTAILAALALAPLAVWAVFVAATGVAGAWKGLAVQPWVAALVVATVAAFLWSLARPTRVPTTA